MTVTQAYDQMLKSIQIDQDEWDDARGTRDELGHTCSATLRAKLGVTSQSIPIGALSQGTQIKPLSDVDLVVTFDEMPSSWVNDPDRVLRDSTGWFSEALAASDTLAVTSVEPSAHAIKIEFTDVNFSADVVIALKQGESSRLLIPHCPDDFADDEYRWIHTDPTFYRDLVKRRNKETSSKFAREVRLLKAWNRQCKLQDPDERKPVSSFHLTVLALRILNGQIKHPDSTADFFSEATKLVLVPSDDLSGAGGPVEAKDIEYAFECFSRAEQLSAKALTASNPMDILKELFGDVDEWERLTGGDVFSIGTAGALIAGSAGARSRYGTTSHGEPR